MIPNIRDAQSGPYISGFRRYGTGLLSLVVATLGLALGGCETYQPPYDRPNAYRYYEPYPYGAPDYYYYDANPYYYPGYRFPRRYRPYYPRERHVGGGHEMAAPSHPPAMRPPSEPPHSPVTGGGHSAAPQPHGGEQNAARPQPSAPNAPTGGEQNAARSPHGSQFGGERGHAQAGGGGKH